MTFPLVIEPGRIRSDMNFASDNIDDVRRATQVMPQHLYYGCSLDEMRDALNAMLAVVHTMVNVTSVLHEMCDNSVLREDVREIVSEELNYEIGELNLATISERLNTAYESIDAMIETKRGPKGDKGPMGPSGEKGMVGPRGEKGMDGRNGVDGAPGLAPEEVKEILERLKDLEFIVSELD